MKLDALFINGRIRTVDPHRPLARAIGVIGERIVGLDDELAGCTADSVYDLGGAPVVPGLHDAHFHLSHFGLEMSWLDVSPLRTPTLDDLYAAVAARSKDLGRDDWLLGYGYEAQGLGGHPDPDVLDRVTGGRPVWLLQASHHGGVAGRSALRRAGLDGSDLPVIDGGEIRIGPDGRVNGVLADKAMALIYSLVRPVPFDDAVQAIALATRAAAAMGLTSVTEPGIAGHTSGNAVNDLAAFQSARDNGDLGVRVTVMPEISALHEMGPCAPGTPGYGLDLGLRTGLGDDWLRVGGVKIFSDGALTMRTAALCCDYADAPGQRGFLLHDAETLRRQIVDAARAGWQVATHAIGDLAVETVLASYEEARRVVPGNQMRHRMEHVGLTSDEHIKRMLAAKVLPVPQGRFLDELGHDYLTAIGNERGQILFRQRSFVDAGLELPGSSDCPVVNGSPLLGMHALVNRELPDGEVFNPGERLTPFQALRAFTHGSAYADHQEHRKGTVTRGKLADFVVLSDDPLEVAPQRIREISVAATVIGGDIRHGEISHS